MPLTTGASISSQAAKPGQSTEGSRTKQSQETEYETSSESPQMWSMVWPHGAYWQLCLKSHPLVVRPPWPPLRS